MNPSFFDFKAQYCLSCLFAFFHIVIKKEAAKVSEYLSKVEKIKEHWEETLGQLDYLRHEDHGFKRKLQLLSKRHAELVRVKGEGRSYRAVETDQDHTEIEYELYLTYVIKQKGKIFIEEEEQPYRSLFYKGELIVNEPVIESQVHDKPSQIEVISEKREREEDRFGYDRLKAVKYAERWWNSYNPEYRKFEVDCTNYISQCLRAGGAPMWGAPTRSKGWWYQDNNWSFSWAVAHSFRWYLSGSTKGLKGREVESATDLLLGDVICYDFEGDEKWNHTTIVVAKDANGEPLVNAHTYNSRQRYWSYEDSTAYTPNCKYKFFRIGE